MSLVLDVGKYQIPTDRVIQQLKEIKLLPQIMEEMTIDELVDRTARSMLIDLKYSRSEFDRLVAELMQLPYCQAMHSTQLVGIIDRRLKLQKFKQAKWGNEIENYFNSQGSGLNRVVLSILQVSDALLAQELRFRIQAGEQSFTEIVLDYSEGDLAENGGVMEPMLVRDLPPGISEIVDGLKEGEISELFQIDLLYTYFRLDRLLPAVLNDQMEKFLLDELFNQWVKVNE
jgi:parvulin-like peptidyl-prolyl isomerase